MESAVESAIDLSQVVFTRHALQQFEVRHRLQCGNVPRDLEKTARKILAGASDKQAIDNARLVRRLIDNNFQPVRYFLNYPWRFIAREENNQLIVLTIEIVWEE